MSRIVLLYIFGITVRSLMLGVLAGLLLLKTRSVEFRHAVGTIVLLSVFLIPIAGAVLPVLPVPAPVPDIIAPIQTYILVAPAVPAQTVPEIQKPVEAPSIDWWRAGFVFGVIVTITLMLRFFRMLCAVRRIRRESQRIENVPDPGTGVALAESPSLRVPITVGFWRPLIILPSGWRDWEDWKLRAVLQHETTHVRRGDWAIATLAAFAKCVFWFNPLSWFLERNLSSLAEQACDEASVRLSGDPQRYAETLLQFAAASRQGHRWMGGIAMAQHKISLRIERVLALKRPGSGVLSRALWIALVLAALPVLYLSAATQSSPVDIQMPSSTQVVQAIRSVPLAPQIAAAIEEPVQTAVSAQAPPTTSVVAPTRSPQVTVQAESVVVQAVGPQNPPAGVNPDLVREIRVILAPVDRAQTGQVQLELSRGNRWNGNSVWNLATGPLDPATRGANANAFTFTLAGIQNRTVQFENASGGTFSYGCSDCSFIVWESGVGAPSATQAPGIVFQLSPDGRSLSATCRAAECRVAMGDNSPVARGALLAYSLALTGESALTFPILYEAAGTRRACFTMLGNVRADGTPFTDADCPGTSAQGSASSLIFSVTR